MAENPWPALTPAMLGKMTQHVVGIFHQLPERPSETNLVYHYTTGAGFAGIIGEKAIWATHVAFTNDSAEYFEASALLRRKVEARKSSLLSVSQARILDKILSLIATDVEEMFHTFVASFTVCRDNLPQWRGYGGQDGKFAIGFDFDHLKLVASISSGLTRSDGWPLHRCYIVPALYDDALKEGIADSVVDFLLREYPVDEAGIHASKIEEFAAQWAESYMMTVTSLAPVAKSSGFKQEEEWRLVVVPTDPSVVSYRNRGALFTPYIPLSLKTPSLRVSGMLFSNPIREVWVGPSAHSKLNKVSAEHFLRREGMSDVTVLESAIPYREL